MKFNLNFLLLFSIPAFGSSTLATVTYDSSVLWLTTSNGIEVKHLSFGYPFTDTAYISNSDSMILKLRKNGGNFAYLKDIELDGSKINHLVLNSGIYGADVKLPALPGYYEVTGSADGSQQKMYFWLILTVGLTENDKSENLFVIYPNPTEKEFTINSTTQSLESLVIYSEKGEKLISMIIPNHEAKISIDGFPKGTYYLHVATKNKRITIKKITIL